MIASGTADTRAIPNTCHCRRPNSSHSLRLGSKWGLRVSAVISRARGHSVVQKQGESPPDPTKSRAFLGSMLTPGTPPTVTGARRQAPCAATSRPSIHSGTPVDPAVRSVAVRTRPEEIACPSAVKSMPLATLPPPRTKANPMTRSTPSRARPPALPAMHGQILPRVASCRGTLNGNDSNEARTSRPQPPTCGGPIRPRASGDKPRTAVIPMASSSKHSMSSCPGTGHSPNGSELLIGSPPA